MTKYGMVIDQERCIGCHACYVACKEENNVPLGSAWQRVLTEGGENMDEPAGTYPVDGQDGTLEMQYLPMGCQHCENPPCVKVCPVNATFKREDGIVKIDDDRCIGCRYCMAACPYNARVFDFDEPTTHPTEGTGNVPQRNTGTVSACTFCDHRVEEDLDTACAVACPANAIIFGDLDDPSSTVSRYRKQYNTERKLEELDTGPNRFYVSGQITPGRPQEGKELEGTEPKKTSLPSGGTSGGES